MKALRYWLLFALVAGCDTPPSLDAPAPHASSAQAFPTAGPATMRATPPAEAGAPNDDAPARTFPLPLPAKTAAPIRAAFPVPLATATPTATGTATPTPTATATPVPIGTASPTPDRTAMPAAERPEPLAVLAAGVRRDLVGGNQYDQFEAIWNQYTPGQRENLVALLEQNESETARVFTLKALVAGEVWDNVVAYATEIRGADEAALISRSTMRDDMDLIQQWNDSCGPSLLQAIAGETDPRYAWELNKLYDVTAIDPDGANRTLAQQQKDWLEEYGGIAVKRGEYGGQGIPIGQMLNDKLTPMVGARYDYVTVGDAVNAVAQIAALLNEGWDVPLRLSWSPPGSAEDSGHFLLAMNTRGAAGNREILIHDSYTGKTAWVAEGELEQASFFPIFTDYARLTHYYLPTPL